MNDGKARAIKVDEIVHRAIGECRAQTGMAEREIYASIMPHIYVVGVPHELVERLQQLIGHVAEHSPTNPIHVMTRLDSKDVEIVVRDNADFIAPSLARDTFMQRRAGDAGSNSAVAEREPITLQNAATVTATEMHENLIVRPAHDSIGNEYVLRLATTPPPTLRPKIPRGTRNARAQKLRILVVDDNYDVANTLATALQISGFNTQTVHDGISAVKVAIDFAPQVVLLDIDLSGMNGFQAARNIRALMMKDKPLLIALTGQGSADDKQRARNAGFDRHYTKPADVRDIIEFIESSLAPAQQQLHVNN